MSPGIASLVCALGIFGLFLLDRAGKAQTSRALWVPVVWLSIAGSRMVSQWLAPMGGGGISAELDSPDRYLEGSPLDRLILSGLLVAGIIVLFRRGRRVWAVLQANGPIIVFFVYCVLSTLWSDYTGVAVRRWFKALGDLVMVLIVLTDRDASGAVKRLLARVGFLLVPISIVFIKYYPDLGRGYHPWTWTPYYTGVTTNKNALGMVCLLFGVASAWRCLEVLRGGKVKGWLGPLVAHGTVLVMVTWLFWMANSMTAFLCFLLASGLMAATTLKLLLRRPIAVHILVASIVFVSVAVLFFDAGSALVGTVGRDPTLTGRTVIWELVMGMASSPILGTGFESFWLGPRLEKIWSLYWWHPNEAHNGYIETFLNLGWIGVILLSALIVTGYRNVIAVFRRDPCIGRLKLAYFVIVVTYNFTESAFRMFHPIWIVFLLASIAIPERSVRSVVGQTRAIYEPDSQRPECLVGL